MLFCILPKTAHWHESYRSVSIGETLKALKACCYVNGVRPSVGLSVCRAVCGGCVLSKDGARSNCGLYGSQIAMLESMFDWSHYRRHWTYQIVFKIRRLVSSLSGLGLRNGKRYTICVNGDLIGIHGRAIE